MGLHRFSHYAGDRKPFVAEDSLVHWPVMFVYPETMQTDAVEDFVEVDSLQQHLDVMFSPDAPPLDWDDEHQYTRDKLELYYLSHAARPLPLEQLTEVKMRYLIIKILQFFLSLMKHTRSHYFSVFLLDV